MCYSCNLLRRILANLHQEQKGPTTIFCDNNSAISLSRNPVFHERTKHIHAKHHYIRDLVKNKEVAVQYCPSEEQVADIFTKPLKAAVFLKLKELMGMMKAEDLGLV